MNGKKIELVLHTPIILELPDPDHPEKLRNETVLRIRGVVTAFSEAGMQIEITDLEDHRRHKIMPVHEGIFIPHHKIDHCFIHS